jgi:hypothetical protein
MRVSHATAAFFFMTFLSELAGYATRYPTLTTLAPLGLMVKPWRVRLISFPPTDWRPALRSVNLIFLCRRENSCLPIFLPIQLKP